MLSILTQKSFVKLKIDAFFWTCLFMIFSFKKLQNLKQSVGFIYY